MKPSVLFYFYGLIGIFILSSCQDDSKKQMIEEVPGLDFSLMDTLVSPKDDFYNFVNGNWMKTTEIPEEESVWGGFGILRKSTRKDVLDIVEKAKASNKYEPETDQAKALFLFDSYLDSLARASSGADALKPALEELNRVTNLKQLQSFLVKNVYADAPFMGLNVLPDVNNSSINSAYLFPAGLGLPERDYYLNDDDKTIETREAYVAHITRMLQFLGDEKSEASRQAKTILALETELAKPRLDKVQRRDFRNYNNPYAIDKLKDLTPAIDWKQFMEDLGVPKKTDTLLVGEPAYMKSLQTFLTQTDLNDLKTLVRWATLNRSAGILSPEIEKANWDFYSKELRGTKAQRDKNERALAQVNRTLGEALGKLYVDEKFPPEAKEKAVKMVSNVILAFKDRIQVLDWMEAETKSKALEKLNKMTVKIGYPDEWEDYSSVKIDAENNYFENIGAVRKWQLENDIADIGEPVDDTEWLMPPQAVNAYFHPLKNEIVFPAAILQPPFYNYLAEEAVNYGGIGAVIGHEISHSFDDSGSRFDADGNLANWWTEKDLKEFEARGGRLAEQYNNIEVLDSLFINGKYTLGENIGDLGGVLGAYDGLQRFYKENGKPGPINGFTAEQRFFLSWGTIWRTKFRDEALRTRIATDTHSPGMYRASQPLKNVDAFYEAFDVKEGDAMYIAPENRVYIW